jgi:dipeptidase
MKKAAGLVALLIVFAALAAGVTAAAPSQAMPRAAAATRLTPAAQLRHAAPLADDCNFVVVGKKASADGSVMLGYNNDWSAANYVYMKVVPARERRYRYVQLLTWGDVPEGGLNEHGLGVLYGVATDTAKRVEARDPYRKHGVGGELWDLILQRCCTPQQALVLIAKLAKTRGFGGDAAGSFAVADANVAWVVEVLGGRHWVAARVPDDAYYAQPNMLRLRHVDLTERASFRGSPDLKAFAARIGRYDPANGPLDVAWAYGNRNELRDPYNTNRLWGVLERWSPSLHADVAMPYKARPVFVIPDRLLTRQDVMAICREHYEGTVLDQTAHYALKSPHAQTDRPICCANTDYSAVWQLRSWMPQAVGDVVWVALSRPCSSAYVPFYAGTTKIPAAWTQEPPKGAYVAFRAVAARLDAKGTVNGKNRYAAYISLVRGAYGGFETDEAAQQASVEATAVGLWNSSPARADTYLTDYTRQRAGQVLALAKTLLAEMP